MRAGDAQAAIPVFQSYLKHCDSPQSPPLPNCAERRFGLGKMLLRQARYAEAESAFLPSHEQKLQTETGHFAPPAKVAEELARLYQQWGKPEQARKWEAAAK